MTPKSRQFLPAGNSFPFPWLTSPCRLTHAPLPLSFFRITSSERARRTPSLLSRIPALVSELQVCSRRKDCSDAVPPAHPAIPSTAAIRAVFLEDSAISSKEQALANLLCTLQLTLLRKQNTPGHRAASLCPRSDFPRYINAKVFALTRTDPVPQNHPCFTRAGLEQDKKLILSAPEHVLVWGNALTSARFTPVSPVPCAACDGVSTGVRWMHTDIHPQLHNHSHSDGLDRLVIILT